MVASTVPAAAGGRAQLLLRASDACCALKSWTKAWQRRRLWQLCCAGCRQHPTWTAQDSQSAAQVSRESAAQIEQGDKHKHVVPLGDDDDKSIATGQHRDRHYRVLDLKKLSKRGRQLVRARAGS